MRPLGMAAQLVSAGVLPDVTPGTVSCMTLDAVPLAPGLARKFVSTQLVSATATQREAAVLLMSELVTNAVLASHGSVEVGVATVDSRVVVAVCDASRRRQPRRSTDPRPTQRSSSLLVKALADEYGTLPHEHGRTLWAVLHERGRAGAAGALEAEVARRG